MRIVTSTIKITPSARMAALTRRVVNKSVSRIPSVVCNICPCHYKRCALSVSICRMKILDAYVLTALNQDITWVTVLLCIISIEASAGSMIQCTVTLELCSLNLNGAVHNSRLSLRVYRLTYKVTDSTCTILSQS